MRIFTKGVIASSRSLGAAFSPSDITSLTDWYDGKSDSDITTAGGSVSQFDSKEGANYLKQTNGPDQPSHNTTTDAVTFAEDILDFNSSVANKSGIVVVSNVNGSDTYPDATGLVSENYDAGGSSYIFFGHGGSFNYTCSLDGGNSDNTGDIAINGYDLEPGNGTGTNINYSDDASYDPFPKNDNGLDIFYYQWTNSTTLTLLGGANSGAEFKSNIKIYETCLFNDSLSTSDRQKMEGYLAHRWGIESKLKTGHPYKSSPP